ncbi:MAG: hypothetical protein ACK5HR_06510 [Mycoplasmatales bacterium]
MKKQGLVSKVIDGKTARFNNVIFINRLPLVMMEFKQSAISEVFISL